MAGLGVRAQGLGVSRALCRVRTGSVRRARPGARAGNGRLTSTRLDGTEGNRKGTERNGTGPKASRTGSVCRPRRAIVGVGGEGNTLGRSRELGCTVGTDGGWLFL